MDTFEQQQAAVITTMQATLTSLQASDPATLQLLAADTTSSLAGQPIETSRQQAIAALSKSITAAQAEADPDSHLYHSRDPLTGLIQSQIANVGPIESQIEDNVIPQLQAYGQGNPVVWIPTGIKGLLEHFKAKHPFVPATAASRIQIPDQCTIALLGDWGANNDHAAAIGQLALSKGAQAGLPQYMIHLGDIYYSGAESECQTFLKNWPLKDADGAPFKGQSFALNGNHEMYSLGFPYFDTVLAKFGQEASYFTLFNDNWQIQGLDTAYVPFTIGGSGLYGAGADANLQPQYDWLLNSILSNPTKPNIFLSHNQPVSAYMPEFQAAQPLINEVRNTLTNKFAGTLLYAWFFGHEHRCIIYDDKAKGPDALFRARLIGNGAIPHLPQTETVAATDNTGASVNRIGVPNLRAIGTDNQVAVSTFAMLTFNGPNCHVDYWDEDGNLFYAEDWNATEKLW